MVVSSLASTVSVPWIVMLSLPYLGVASPLPKWFLFWHHQDLTVLILIQSFLHLLPLDLNYGFCCYQYIWEIYMKSRTEKDNIRYMNVISKNISMMLNGKYDIFVCSQLDFHIIIWSWFAHKITNDDFQ